jgi:hypothetical protein
MLYGHWKKLGKNLKIKIVRNQTMRGTTITPNQKKNLEQKVIGTRKVINIKNE